MYILQSSYLFQCFTYLFKFFPRIFPRVFPKVFPCKIGLQSMRLVEQSIEDLGSTEIKEPVMSEYCE